MRHWFGTHLRRLGLRKLAGHVDPMVIHVELEPKRWPHDPELPEHTW